ncbi:MAG TPA: hypothetical protein VJR27_05830 [Candidatus Saccharimonadales bacterium]|nr:hypothetical protein [Candidatus Saccharimonadales bacterium]
MPRPKPLGPDTIHKRYHIVPGDPYDEDALTFSVLAARGYPVSLQPVSRGEVLNQERKVLEGSDVARRLHTEAKIQRYRQWVQPVAHHPDYNRFYPDGAGFEDHAVTDEEEKAMKTFFDHPANYLVSAVGDGNPRAVDIYKKRLDEGLVPPMNRPVDIRRVFLAGCFVAAMQRMREPGVGEGTEMTRQRYTFLNPQGSLDYDTSMRRFNLIYRTLTEQRGIQPISPENLAGLVNDLYAFAEPRVPQLASYRELKPQPVASSEELSY